MSQVQRFLDALAARDSVVLEGNQASVARLREEASALIRTERRAGFAAVSYWRLPDVPDGAGLAIAVMPTGHLVLYGDHGRRVLGTDPDGTPLHECEWTVTASGETKLARARIQLDCQQWVGIRPGATEQVSTFEAPPRSGSPAPTPEALRQMAAKAWAVPLEDIRYFYPDGSITREADGRVTVRLNKDGLYLLEDGTFTRERFVSYMGAIPWARIDLLNVVELYQSTLPGTGGAAFDLIWGLCQDQQMAYGPIPLRYRGLPTFPSDQAYGLFCAFFRPEPPAGEDPYKMFMDTQRAYQIAWWPRPDPPWRFFDRARRLCVTVQEGTVQKVTVVDDPVAVPYVNIGMRGFASCERTVAVTGDALQLRDGSRVTEVPIDPRWGITRDSPLQPTRAPSYPFGWRALFRGDPPKLDPARAWTTVLSFPDDDTPIEEESTQLFVLEQIYDYLNQLPNLPARLTRIRQILIHNFDPVCAGFVDPDSRSRRYTILYNRPEWAQKNAQAIWDRAAREGRLEAVREVEFVPEQDRQVMPYGRTYDLVYRWIPYASYDDPWVCQTAVREVAQALAPLGLGFLVGPPLLVSLLPLYGLQLRCYGGPEDLKWLPAMVEHYRIHPNTRVNPDLAVVLGVKAL